jgi:hypothetical protein
MATKKEPVLVQTADHIEWLIDESLEQTFRASDPLVVTAAGTIAFDRRYRLLLDGSTSPNRPEGMP